MEVDLETTPEVIQLQTQQEELVEQQYKTLMARATAAAEVAEQVLVVEVDLVVVDQEPLVNLLLVTEEEVMDMVLIILLAQEEVVLIQ